MIHFIQGIYTPAHPEKYVGNLEQIVYRSSWEMGAFSRIDHDSNIVEWSSEEIAIPYVSPIDGRGHRYYPDLKLKFRNGTVKLIEIKPASQIKPPKRPKRQTKKFLYEAAEWGRNQAKWRAAQEYCADRKWAFEVWTEHDLGIG